MEEREAAGNWNEAWGRGKGRKREEKGGRGRERGSESTDAE